MIGLGAVGSGHPRASSLTELAHRIGVAERTLRYWEAGQTRPSRRHARALARELGVSVEELGLEDRPSEEDGPAPEERA